MFPNAFRNIIFGTMIFAAGIFSFKSFIVYQINKDFHGDFDMKFPEGWERIEWKKQLVVYRSPENLEKTTRPEAAISVWVKPMSGTDWIESYFPELKQQVIDAENRIVGEGETRRGDHKLFWLLFETKNRDAINLEYYAITPKDIFIRVQFQTHPTLFKKYTPIFADIKDTIVIKGDAWE